MIFFFTNKKRLILVFEENVTNSFAFGSLLPIFHCLKKVSLPLGYNLKEAFDKFLKKIVNKG